MGEAPQKSRPSRKVHYVNNLWNFMDWFRHSEVGGLEVRGSSVRVRKRLSKNFTFIMEGSAV